MEKIDDDRSIVTSIYAARVKGVDAFYQSFEALLDNPNAINDPDLGTFKDIVGKLGFMFDEEKREAAGHILGGLAEFRAHHQKEAFKDEIGMKNATMIEVENMFDKAKQQNFINEKVKEKEITKVYSYPKVVRQFYYLGKNLRWMSAIWELISGTFKASMK